MKKVVFLLVFLVVVSGVIFAQSGPWSVSGNVNIDGIVVRVSVYNMWPRPIICSGRAVGITAQGLRLYSIMTRQVIMPGQFAYVYIHSNPYDPFIDGWGDFQCNWY